jgi:hypothetical protein
MQKLPTLLSGLKGSVEILNKNMSRRLGGASIGQRYAVSVVKTVGAERVKIVCGNGFTYIVPNGEFFVSRFQE